MNMMMQLTNLLAQVDIKKLDADMPRISPNDAGSTTSTWIMVAIIVVGILLIAFKQARRNFRD